MEDVPPPDIWTYDECAAVNTDAINIAKEYKPSGQFYADTNMLCTIYGLKPHPVFREPVVLAPAGADGDVVGGFEEQKRAKEPTTISVSRTRLDPNSMKVLFKVLEGCSHIQTLKLQNCGLTHSSFLRLIGYLNADNCPILNFFVDWNPCYTDDFKCGTSGTLWKAQEDEDVNPWAKLVETSKKLQVLFLRANKLTDADFVAMSTYLKANTTIKVLDVSSNPDLGKNSLEALAEIMNGNRSIEYFGLSKLGLSTDMVLPLFNLIGRFPFPADEVENHLKELKARDVIIEKNKKLKSQKKPEEPVPQLDDIEEIKRINEQGEEIAEWVTIKNPQIKHLNFCMNSIEDDIEKTLTDVIDRTQDEFSVTLSSNKVSEEMVERLHSKITKLHKAQIDFQIQKAEAEGAPSDNYVIDQNIHLKRLTV